MWKVLENLWSEYQNLLTAGESYSAFVRVGEIYASLDGLQPDLRAEFKRRCETASVSSETLKSILAGVEGNRYRIRRILSIGNSWNDDELLLVIVLKVQIDSLTSFLRHRGFELPEEIPDSLDMLIQKVATSKRNRRAFDSARSLACKNRDLPVKHHLLIDAGGSTDRRGS
jgi:hypothetical protein